MNRWIPGRGMAVSSPVRALLSQGGCGRCSGCRARQKRMAADQPLAERIAGSVEPQDVPYRIAAFVLGIPGAGKSKHIKELRHINYKEFAVIDPDQVKEWLPGYDPHHPEAVHERSLDVARQAAVAAIERGVPFYYTATGGGTRSLAAVARQAKERGYSTHLHYVQCPLEVALERAAQRERRVPPEVIRQRAETIESALADLRATGLFDFWSIFDNSDHLPDHAGMGKPALEVGSPEHIAATCY